MVSSEEEDNDVSSEEEDNDGELDIIVNATFNGFFLRSFVKGSTSSGVFTPFVVSGFFLFVLYVHM